MRCPRILASCVLPLLLALPLAGAEGNEGRFLAQRAGQRQERQAIQEMAAKDRLKRAQDAAKEIRRLIEAAAKAPAAWQRPALEQLIAGVARLDPALDPILTGELKPLTGGGEPTKSERSAWERKVDAARQRICDPLQDFCTRALNAGVIDVAFQLMLDVLAFWPEHPDLHRNLGLTKVGDRWYGPQDMEQVRAGFVWDADQGWVPAKEQKRRDAGGFYDLQAKAWTTLDKAEQAHSTWKNPWLLRTEHLEIRGTAPLADLVHTADALERFYARVFGVYAGFFAPGGRGDLRLVFGLAKHPRLQIHIAKDPEDYRTSLPAGIEAGWSSGMFIPMVPSSYFYAGPPELFYHEFTHQILHVFTGGNAAPAWAAEGVAVYSQAPVMVDGGLEFGHLDRNDHLLGFLLHPEDRLPFERIIALDDQGAWMRAAKPGPNYASAGMLVQFCMEADHHAPRADFIDYLRDAYQDKAQGHPVWSYLGLTREELGKRFAAWVATLPPPRPRR